MAGRPLDLTERQIRAICKGARQAGCVPVISIGNATVRLVPKEWVVETDTATDPSDWDEVLAESAPLDPPRVAKRAVGAGGYEIPGDGAKFAPLREHYARLGFDPETMGRDDMARLREAAELRWKASIPGTPLNRRERAVLFQLKAHGVSATGQRLKWMGPDTKDRLEARGFIEVRDEGYALTTAGLEAARAIDAPSMPV